MDMNIPTTKLRFFDVEIEVPTAEYLKECEEKEPGSAARIMDAWERKGRIDHSQAMADLRAHHRREMTIMTSLFVGALSLLVGSAILIFLGVHWLLTIPMAIGAMGLNTYLMVRYDVDFSLFPDKDDWKPILKHLPAGIRKPSRDTSVKR